MNFLKNKKILVSAGPTQEPIDPVRFISNKSSGKMGYAISDVLAENEAEVVLVSGPVCIRPHHSSINLISVNTAKEMYEVCIKEFASCDAAIMAAAVADYTIDKPANQKIKKNGDTLQLNLIRTKDILLQLGKNKKTNQVLAGFALETQNETQNAIKKVHKKNLDFIVLNSLNDKGAGFQHNTNKITIIDSNNNLTKFELKPKKEVAKDIVRHLNTCIKEKNV